MTADPANPRRGDIFRVGRKLYGICTDCGNIVRLDKPLLGALHFCAGA